MHIHSTSAITEKATPAITRRAVIAGAGAAIFAQPTIAVADSLADELAWLIDQHDEVKAANNRVNAEIELLSARPDHPAWPTVTLADLDHKIYAVTWRRSFETLDAINQFFVKFPDAHWFDAARSEKHDANHRQALSLFYDRRAEFECWHDEVGLSQLYSRDEELSEIIHRLEVELVDYPCLTHRDCIAKAEWYGRAFDIELGNLYARRVLQSMTGMTASPEGGC